MRHGMIQCGGRISVLLGALIAAATVLGGQVEHEWSTIDCGGGASGGIITITGTIGQMDAGQPMTGGDFALVGGFWAIEASATPTSCQGDLDFDGVVGGADLGILLGAWGVSSSPADLTNDGVVDGSDLGVLLGAWGACQL